MRAQAQLQQEAGPPASWQAGPLEASDDDEAVLRIEGGAVVTPQLAQVFLAIYCSRLPGVDGCACWGADAGGGGGTWRASTGPPSRRPRGNWIGQTCVDLHVPQLFEGASKSTSPLDVQQQPNFNRKLNLQQYKWQPVCDGVSTQGPVTLT
jgi:hypothetical protein